ncbi:MAG: GNAT family N-acetyltransferase [Candidatus Helarchaeota archaeon]
MTPFIEKKIKLKNGLEVLIREIREDDAEKLIEMFEHLSDETKYTRFMKFRKTIMIEDLKPFLKSSKENFAIVAELERDGKKIIIADGRYYLDDPPDRANVAIVVRDDFQRQGLAHQMLSILIDVARENNIKYFHGEILLENSKMLNFIKKTGYEYEHRDESGVRYFNIDLEQIKTPL